MASVLLRRSLIARIINDKKKIVIYGGGELAEALICELKNNRWDALVQFVVVSNKGSCERIMDYPVYSIDEKEAELRTGRYAVLIASVAYEDEISKNLEQRGISAYYKIADYDFWNNRLQRFETLNEEGVMRSIDDWLKQVGETDSTKEIIDKRKSSEQNKVVFVIGYFTRRIFKIVCELRDKGVSVSSIMLPLCNDDLNVSEDMRNSGFNVIKTTCVEEVMYHLLKIYPSAMHLICKSRDNVDISILVKFKNLFAQKCIYEAYDILCDMYNDISEKQIQLEKYCMENADGICCRAYETEYLDKVKKYKIHGKYITLLDGCEEKKWRKKHTNPNELHLCYVGGIAMEEEWPNSAQACFVETAKKCEENKCHLHVYPSVWDENRWNKFLLMDKSMSYFHFHKPVNSGDLVEEISKYDYGIFPLRKVLRDKGEYGYNTKEKYKYTAANKFFDYIDAGLPIIAASPELLMEEFKRENIVYTWTIDEYDYELLRKTKREMKEQVCNVRKKWSMCNLVDSLIELYDIERKNDRN